MTSLKVREIESQEESVEMNKEVDSRDKVMHLEKTVFQLICDFQRGAVKEVWQLATEEQRVSREVKRKLTYADIKSNIFVTRKPEC